MRDESNQTELDILTFETQEIPDIKISDDEDERINGKPARSKKKPADPKKTPSRHKRSTASQPHRKNAAKSGAHRTKSHASGSRTVSGKHSSRKKKKKAAQRRNFYIHAAIIATILLIGILGLIRLLHWNKGRESDYDPSEISMEFDTEPEDYFVPQNSETVALQKNDGITSILLLGNGSLARTKGQDDSIGKRLGELTGGKVYDASIDHTYLSFKNVVYDEEYPTDVFSLYWISQCISTGDYSPLENTAPIWNGDGTIQETVDMLKNLDMDAIDVIMIMYDYHDYEAGRLLIGPYDDTLAATCCGCLLQSIRLLRQAFPNTRIIVSSPYFVYIEDKDGERQPGSTLNLGQGTLADYMIAFKNIAVSENVSFIDNYFGTITEDNYAEYLEDDKEHLNSKGRNAIAKRMASFIGSAP